MSVVLHIFKENKIGWHLKSWGYQDGGFSIGQVYRIWYVYDNLYHNPNPIKKGIFSY